MKDFDWNADKNIWLQQQREINFEVVVFHIQSGNLLDIIDHPNPSKYPDQGILVVDIDNYVYLVPFVEEQSGLFLKTIIPSRKATRDYRKKGRKHG